jgi:LmbE family N-acetylglucosaminyl deacetylase
VASPLPDDQVERVLFVTAHPDDVDFGTAGTAALWSQAGISVTYLICTDGQAGGFDDGIDRAEIPTIRRAEQRAAAAAVGVQDVRFLGLVDGALTVTSELVEQITAVVRDVRPQRVVAQSPERDWRYLPRSHPDHLAAGEATVQAVYPAARNPYAFPQLRERGLPAWEVADVWLAGHPTTTHAVDVTSVWELKMAAILAHESQHPEPAELDRNLRTAFREQARASGLAEGRLAEAYFVVRLS